MQVINTIKLFSKAQKIKMSQTVNGKGEEKESNFRIKPKVKKPKQKLSFGLPDYYMQILNIMSCKPFINY